LDATMWPGGAGSLIEGAGTEGRFVYVIKHESDCRKI
jgi:hypothetical protein